MGRSDSSGLILRALMDGDPMSCRGLIQETGLKRSQVYGAISRCWRSGHVLRTENAILEHDRVFRGRRGVSRHLHPYHLYMLRPEGVDEASVSGRRFVGFSKKFLDPRGGGKISKAKRILVFLQENQGGAFFSTDIVEALSEYGVRIQDVMPNIRRFERKGLVYVRGYKTDERQTPFKEGYLLTWIDQDIAREDSVAEAVKRTDVALAGRASSSPTMERVHRIRDIILEHTQLRKLVAASYIDNKLGATRHETEHALSRALQLYPDMKELKIFDNWRYYYHTSMSLEDLDAAVEMKRNYIRKAKGRTNRIGHNWEAVAEWFIDKFTTGARFWTQKHRKGGMDPRRITLHLLRGVGGRLTGFITKNNPKKYLI